MNTFAANVRVARAEMTQREFGDLVGVDTLTVSRWERGAVRPTIENLAALCHATGRDMAWFYTPIKEAA